MIERLRGIVGDAGVRTGEAAARWAVHGAIPAAVVVPGSVEEAAAVLALASAEGWRVEPAGAGTWLGWGRAPGRVDLVVSTARLAEVEAHEPEDLTAVVGAGLTLGELEARLTRHGQWLPLDPPRGGAGTVGAAVSLAEAGPLRLAHGTPRDHVLGLTLVTGDGRVLELGGRVVKNVAGFDLVKLTIGSRGTLGLVCRVAVRLRPLPERDATLVVPAAGAEAALDAVAAVRGARVEPAALELVSPPAAELAGVPPGAWAVVVRLQGNAEAVADAEARVGRAVGGGVDALGVDPARALWAALGEREAGAALVARLADWPSALADTVAAVLELPGAAVAWPLLAHAGSGIVRAAVSADAYSDAAAETWAAALSRARTRLEARGGTLLGARLPAAVVAAGLDPFGDPGPALRLMQGLRKQFDPAGILAVGRFVV
ncbi:MAG TPA: FAD-binding oxidoreductase [Longimicrobiales bacterium]